MSHAESSGHSWKFRLNFGNLAKFEVASNCWLDHVSGLFERPFERVTIVTPMATPWQFHLAECRMLAAAGRNRY